MLQKATCSERIYLSPPHIHGDELTFINEAFKSNYIAPLGPQVDAFERDFSKYTGISHCVALSSGTAALHLALKNIGLVPGDEVYTATITFIGSVSSVIFEGATPVFIDCDKSTWNMDPDLLAEALEDADKHNRLPKAVIPTDLYGQCADYDRINTICAAYDVPVIIDSAEAAGARYDSLENGSVHAGFGAKAAAFSFNGNKIITTSGGGMLASEDAEFIAKARFLAQQARDPFPHYEHSEIGYNYRMSNIIAAIGLGQLAVLDDRVARKREIFNYYEAALSDLPGIEFMPEAVYGTCTRWLTVILITPSEFGCDRETVRLALETENIESRPVWKPMHMQPVFDVSGYEVPDSASFNSSNPPKKRYHARVIGGSVSEDLFARGLCLPSGTAMSTADLGRVVDVIRSCCANSKREEHFLAVSV